MTANRLFNLLIVVGLLIITSCAPRVAVTPAQDELPPIKLSTAPTVTATIAPTASPTITPTAGETLVPTVTAQPTEAAT